MARYRGAENKGKKNSTIYTPEDVSKRIGQILKESGIKTDIILDLGVGEQGISKFTTHKHIIGVDPSNKEKFCDTFFKGKLEKLKPSQIKQIQELKPDIVMTNPPFNGCPDRKLYPELFLDWVVEHFGKDKPMVMITPMGLRLNQRRASKRWRKMKDGLQITSILSLPIDTFDGVLFHVEVLFFNIPNIKPHYFLED